MPGSSTEAPAVVSLPAQEFSLHVPLRTLIRRPPACVPPSASIREALERMDGERIGSVLIAEGDGAPLGILTFGDVLRRIVLSEEANLWRPVDEVMTRGVVSLGEEASAYDAVLLMARRNVRYVSVLDRAGKLIGVVSRGDLYSTQRIASEDVVNAALSARTIPELAAAAAKLRAFSHRLVSQGLGAEQIIQWISSLNDIIALHAIDLVVAQHELPDVPWAWLAFGSEGRFEQTLATDQDNGIIFAAADATEAEALRPRFIAFAQAVNAALDACGFPLCKGEIMAGNPLWCLSEAEWRQRFLGWITHGEPEALLNACIFFDFRSLYGEVRLAESLRDWLTEHATGAALFLRLMAINALACKPPLGLIRDFSFERNVEHPRTLELKRYGVRPFVDAARLFALQQGLRATNTAQRLREAARHESFGGEDIAATIDGFHFIQMLRLRNQQGEVRYGSPNRIDPYGGLNHLERQVLKHAFRQARHLQDRLQAEFRL
jgi:CBS domain-containing protein